MSKLNRDRLLNAVVFFAENVCNCGKTKLFKLLYLLDFEHFRQTGKSVTGGEYQAWKFGPVPVNLAEKWDSMDTDLARLVRIESERVFDHTRYNVVVKDGVSFDPENFTPRQIRIMEDLATRYWGCYSEKLIDVTHEENGAWDVIWNDGEGAFETIPYELSIPPGAPDRNEILAIAEEQRMYQEAMELSRKSELNSWRNDSDDSRSSLER